MPARAALVLSLLLILVMNHANAQAVVHLTFDDANNLTADSSGNGHNASANGNPGHSNSGAAGGALQLDGNSSLALDSNVAGVLSGNFTVSLWVRTTQTVGSNTDNPGQGIGLVYAPGQNGDDLPVALNGSVVGADPGNSTLHSQSQVNNGDWVNVVLTHDAGNGVSSLFVNGSLEASQQGSATANAVHNLLLLGANPSSGNFLTGQLDDFQLYDQVIPASSVAYLHANPGSALFAAVPEPSTCALLAVGIAPLCLVWRQRRQSAAAAKSEHTSAAKPARRGPRRRVKALV